MGANAAGGDAGVTPMDNTITLAELFAEPMVWLIIAMGLITIVVEFTTSPAARRRHMRLMRKIEKEARKDWSPEKWEDERRRVCAIGEMKEKMVRRNKMMGR